MKDKKETFLLFHLIGYNTKKSEMELIDRVDISLIDEQYDSAVERAKKLVNRNIWFLFEVVEYLRKDCK